MQIELEFDLKIALEKISRKTGEDEDDFVYDLELMGISIPENQVSVFGRYVALKIFDENNDIEKRGVIRTFEEHYRSNLNRLRLESIYKNDSNEPNYIIIECLMDLSEIEHNIIEDLKEEHSINPHNYTESDWMKIKETILWHDAITQVARELVALRIYEIFPDKLIEN
ncbi:MAG: hypothetical protein GF311_12245 [Candidatus Lokiarchaeota archaeon]|nr:hypothetical protein [Candidatus Lokiarchaeota archaeon]